MSTAEVKGNYAPAHRETSVDASSLDEIMDRIRVFVGGILDNQNNVFDCNLTGTALKLKSDDFISDDMTRAILICTPVKEVGHLDTNKTNCRLTKILSEDPQLLSTENFKANGLENYLEFI